MLDSCISLNIANALKLMDIFNILHQMRKYKCSRNVSNYGRYIFHYEEQEHPQMSENLVEKRSMHIPRVLYNIRTQSLHLALGTIFSTIESTNVSQTISRFKPKMLVKYSIAPSQPSFFVFKSNT